ncbi:MAG: ABC transporter ATP-binding protein [Myxococcota bacterium]
MTWGGGGGGGWGHGATPIGDTGLPFAGIPPEYLKRINELMRRQEDVPVPDVDFSHRSPQQSSFTLRRFFAPHAKGLLVALALVTGETLFAQVGPRLTGYGIDHGVMAGNFRLLLWVGVAYIVSIGLHALLNFARVSWTGRIGQRLMYDLRVRVFEHLQRLSIDFYTREKAGRIMTRMTSDIEALQSLFSEGLVQLSLQGLTLVVMIGFMLTMSVPLTLVLLLGIAPVMVVLTLWFRGASDQAYDAVRERIADLLADLQESLSGVRIVAMHNRQERNTLRHWGVVQRNKDANLWAARIAAIYDGGSAAVGVAGQVLVLAIGGSMVINGSLSLGGMIAFLIYLPQFFGPIQQLVQLHNTYQSGRAAVNKLRDVLDQPPSVPELPDAAPLPPIEGRITLENVTFGYDDDLMVLHDVDLEITPGETVVLVGDTGSGKSTIAKLITRFYDPQQGRILIDGHDLRDVTLRSLRSQLGVIPQEPFLFAGTIRENIGFARPSASDEEVLEVCRAVGIEALIDRLPEGIETPCHERGVALSSGERQLIALARAFLAQPRVLVLDEATSNLDLQTEGMVEHALDALLGGRSAILVAHRLSTAMRADRIAVIHQGRVVELGAHDELVALGGRYAAMFHTWSRQGRSEARVSPAVQR